MTNTCNWWRELLAWKLPRTPRRQITDTPDTLPEEQAQEALRSIAAEDVKTRAVLERALREASVELERACNRHAPAEQRLGALDRADALLRLVQGITRTAEAEEYRG